jgi:glycosyltransferase involved in cell wall biosynthesis
MLTPALGMGGAEVLVVTWSAGLVSRGHTVAVAYGARDHRVPELRERGVDIFRVSDLEPELGTLAQWGRAVRGVAAKFRPHVIHAQSIAAAPVARLAALRTPLLVTVHGIHHSDEQLAAVILRLTAGRVTAVSEASAAGLRRRPLAPRIEVLRTGIDPARIVAAASEPIADLPPGSPRFCCVARHDPAKGIDVLIRALPRVLENLDGATLTLVGDGEDLEANRSLVAELGLEDRVHFAGASLNPAPYIQACDITVLPSRREGLPLVALESLALERPLVASAVGGTPTIVRDGESGWLVAPEDPAALAAAMIAAGSDARVARERGVAGRAIVDESFTSDGTLDQLERLFMELLRCRS